MAKHRAPVTAPRWFRVHPDPAANVANYRAARFVCVFVLAWTPLMGGVLTLATDPAPVPTPPLAAECTTDSDCARWEAERAALHGVRLVVVEGEPMATPLFDPASGRVECPDPATPVMDTPHGAACR